MAKLRWGTWGWIGLAAYITVVDAILIRKRRPTLSEVFGNAIKNPKTRWPLIGLWSLITLHLFAELLPESIRKVLRPLDPLGRLAELIEQTA